jgi:hypothetical protein
MSGQTQFQRTPRARRLPRVEWLECRALLSGGLPGVTMASPYDGQVLTQSPQQFVVTFSQFEPASFVFDLGNSDFQLSRVNGGGATNTAIWNDFTETPIVIGQALNVTLQAADANFTLTPGTYELDLVGGTGLSSDASGAWNNPPEQLWDPTANQPIGDFTVTTPPPLPPVVSPLGTIGPNVTTVQGTVTPSDSSTGAAIYQFTLAAGTYW